MDWETPPENFCFVLFERVDPAENMARYYFVGWLPTLFDAGAVVRMYGRKEGAQQIMCPQPFDSLDAAWPLIRSIIKTRLRHKYRVVGPEEYCKERS